MAYLFVHFKEKITTDGEQVYFSVSKNGYDWEKLNSGEPVLISKMGTGGCRDIEIARLKNGGFVIITSAIFRILIHSSLSNEPLPFNVFMVSSVPLYSA